MILEGERNVDSANQLVEAAETKEVKLRKEHKKLKKVINNFLSIVLILKSDF